MNLENAKRYVRAFFRQPRVTFDELWPRIKIRIRTKVAGRTAILIERPSGIGDIICTFPAVLAMRERHPGAILVYGVQREFMPIVKMGNVADVIVESNWSKLLPNPSIQDYSARYRLLLEDVDPKIPSDQHLVDVFSESLQVSPKSRQPRLHVPLSLSRFAKRKLRGFHQYSNLVFGIHIGPSWPVREWPVESWQKLVEMIHARYRCVILQLGSDSETATGKILSRRRIAGTDDWVGQFSLAQTVAIIESLDLLIGIDSGLLHIAGAVSTPCIGLFGAVDPKFRLPPETPSMGVTANVPCLGCQHRHPILHWKDDCPFSIACMNQLTPEAAFNAVSKIIQNIHLGAKLQNRL